MKKIKNNLYWLIVIGFVIFAALVFIICGEGSVISVHDNLDLFIPQYKMMKDAGTFFTHGDITGFLAGIDRDVLPSEFNLYTMVFFLLPDYTAYIVCWFLKIFIALFGAMLLGKDVFKEEYGKYAHLIVLSGFAYGILNLFPNFGIAFASIPLLVFILRKIVTKPNFWWFLCLFLYPLVSYFSYLGIFFIGYLCVYFVYRWIAKKKFPWQVLVSIIVLSAGYVLCEYRLFYTMLIDSQDTIRVSMVQASLGFGDILKSIGESFLIGDMHTDSVHRFFVMPLCLGFVIFQTILYIRKKEAKKIFKDPLNGVILFILFNSVIYGLYYWEPLRDLFEFILPPLKGFEFQRTEFTNPFLWYLALFIVVKRLYDMLPKFKWIPGVLVTVSIFIIVLSGTRYNDLYHTCYDRYCRIVHGKPSNDLTYEEFFSEDLFEEIKEDIDYSGQWAVAYGFYPAVLEYNGINTLDGYLGYYSDFYKKEFRKMIEPALERVPESKEYFDNWGARCYMYSGTYVSNTNAYRDYDITEEDLYINLDAFKDWGGRYIFSRMELTNAEEVGLDFIDEYSDKNSPYDVYVYRTTSIYQSNHHSEVPFEERKGLTYDLDRFDEILDEFDELIEEAGDDPVTEEEAEHVKELYSECMDIMDRMSTCRVMAEIEYYGDVANDDLVEKKDEIYEDLLDYNDFLLASLRDLANSPYEDALKESIRSEIVDSLKEYEDMTDEEKDRSLKLESLQSEYEQATMDTYYYEYKDEEWTEEMLYERMGELSRKELKKIIAGLYEEKAKVMGEIFLEIIQLENEIAKEEGYDSYADYAYENLYVRDYTVDDVKNLCKEVREECADDFANAENIVGKVSKYDPGYFTDDDRATYEEIYEYLDEISPELQVSLKHLLDCNLFDLKSSPTKPDKGFTIALPYYGDAYIFDSPYLTSRDIFTYVHEFGHYNNNYFTQEDDFENFSNIDTSEIHSQGLEVLFSRYYKDMYGDEAGAYLQAYEIYSLMQAVYSACKVAEFEIYAHEHPDCSIEDLGKKYAELSDEYGDSFLGFDEDYTWVDIPHIFVQPCYYISYATSALAALDIYSISLENYDHACEKYMQISALKSYWLFKETIKYVGLPDVFEKGVCGKIFEDCYQSMKKNTKGYR
ncbi:MAG: DUF6044 family protein [Lachnospiraceae bacterium]|nr:DUF6044 family protein [Lachnospiraceae bacterium]